MSKKKKYKAAKAGNQQQKASVSSSVLPKSIRPFSAKAGTVITGSWKINISVFVLLVIATVVLYSGDLHIGFFDLDDAGYVTDDPFIKSVSAENLSRIFSAPYFANYSPLHLLSYMIDYSIGGPDPYIFHLSSNIWAGIVSGFVFLVALAFTRNYIISVGSAVLFIVHPVHVEAIAWIASRKDLVAAAFILPSLLAYMRYRKKDEKKFWWYSLSLILFIFALAGKLSVATFPAVLLVYDFFMEKRPLAKSLLDKIPFLVIAGWFAFMVASAQPPSGHKPEPYVLFTVLAHFIGLLSGFGTYVVYRLPIGNAGIIFQIICFLLLLAVFILPIFLRKRFPLVAVLIYWLLFTFIPAQILSFVHPVTDRYLFLPSVAAVILIAFGIFSAAKKWLGKRNALISSAILFIITIFWIINTLNYLSEWKDPRSVWYAAVTKSSDMQVHLGLGMRYQDLADGLNQNPRGKPVSKEQAIQLASLVWANDPRLPSLLSELNEVKPNGSVKKIFQDSLRSLAWNELEIAVRTKTENVVMPIIFFRRGLLLFDNGKLEDAKKEFLKTADEAKLHSVIEAKEEFLVRGYNALGVVYWTEQNYAEALRYLNLANDEQTKSNGNWVPELPGNLKRLKNIVASEQPKQN